MGGTDGSDLLAVDKLKVCKSGMAIARVLWPYAIAPRLAWPPLAPFWFLVVFCLGACLFRVLFLIIFCSMCFCMFVAS
jgi:hypothetical protein